MATTLRSLLGGQVDRILAGTAVSGREDSRDDAAERAIVNRTDLPPTEKQQLVRARRGQGIFRTRLEQLEKSCRVTGVTMAGHLRASHAKPWRDSTDAEKLDGANGLLLSPHVDHLFDRGYIAFSATGDVLTSSNLPSALVDGWGLQLKKNVGAFTPAQQAYLAYHRERVFRP